jgi:hypothetical protein
MSVHSALDNNIRRKDMLKRKFGYDDIAFMKFVGFSTVIHIAAISAIIW